MLNSKISKIAALNALIDHCHITHYNAKQIIAEPGIRADKLYYIVEGSVSIEMEAEDGQNMVLTYLNSGRFIGEAGIFVGSSMHGVTIRTRSKCHFAEITYSRLHDLLDGLLFEHAASLVMLFAEQLSSRLLESNRKVESLAFMDVEQRIGQTLVDLTRQPEAIQLNEGVQIRISRMEISRIVSCSREMAGRVISSMVEKGLIAAKGMTIVVFGSNSVNVIETKNAVDSKQLHFLT